MNIAAGLCRYGIPAIVLYMIHVHLVYLGRLCMQDVCTCRMCVHVYVTGSEKMTLIARVVLCSSGGFKANTVALSISVF